MVEGIDLRGDVVALREEVLALRNELHTNTVALKKKTAALEKQTAALGRKARTRRRLVAAAVCAVVVMAGFTQWQINENNERWCPVVEPLTPHPGDPEPVGTPEQVERSRRIRSAFSDLSRNFGCTP